MEKGGGAVSDVLKRMIRTSLNDPGVNYLVPEKEFWDADRARIEIKKAGYFNQEAGAKDDNGDVEMGEDATSSSLPDTLKEVYENDVIMAAFGGLISYLRSVKIIIM